MRGHVKRLSYMSTRRIHNLSHVQIEEQDKLVEHGPHCRHSIHNLELDFIYAIRYIDLCRSRVFILKNEVTVYICDNGSQY